ncbi:MAG TPA: RidA family protein [Gemmatales bacterium]|nr:RidA family protein [Gemmatales bacterium]
MTTSPYGTLPLDAANRLQDLHLTLPAQGGKPVAVYKAVVQVGNMLYVSGQVPVQNDGSLIKGKVGDDFTLEQGQQAARQCALTMLATIKNNLGSLNKIKRLVKSLGMVNSTPTFVDHPKVINGFSELMREVYGEDNGVGARSAVGVAALPSGVAVEVEAIFELN